jgi:hypothetical protein
MTFFRHGAISGLRESVRHGKTLLKLGGNAMAADISLVVSELQDRLAKAKAEIARHQKAIDELQVSIRDAEITIKTLRDLGVITDHPNIDPTAALAKIVPMAPPRTKTLPEMVIAILGSRDVPPEGLKPQTIAERIKERFGVEPEPNSIGPGVWRMAKDGRLISEGGLYRLGGIGGIFN